MKLLLRSSILALTLQLALGVAQGQQRSADVTAGVKKDLPPLVVKKTTDFQIDGTGNGKEWGKAQWQYLTKLDTGGTEHMSRFKLMYSEKGIYLLFNGEDEKISTRFDKDFSSIFNGDVFEAFFHPVPEKPVYFEYEINPLEKELILVLGRVNGRSTSWIPWNYRPERHIKRKVVLVGGEMKADSPLKSWSAEVFFPYEILGLLPEVPPVSGSSWNANICRLDYDTGKMKKYSWSPAIQTSFHEIEHYGKIVFE